MGVELSLCGSIQLIFLAYEELWEALTATMTADREFGKAGERWEWQNLDSWATRHFHWFILSLMMQKITSSEPLC